MSTDLSQVAILLVVAFALWLLWREPPKKK